MSSNFRTRWLAVALVLIVVAAWRSEGFLNADEHFQTLEFAGAKLGRTPVSALPWEYHARMRPWLQPGIYTLVARGLSGIGVEDPFEWAFVFRLLSGLAAWIGLVGLSSCCERWFAEASERRLAIRLLVLLYCVPFLAVRTSCESLSDSCFVLALSYAVLEGEPGGVTALLIGLLLGLSFDFRYAAGVMVVSLLAWMALIRGMSFRQFAWSGLGMTCALAAALVVDRWGYGAWTFAPWNYVGQNLVAGRAAAQFGAEPWYGYLAILAHGPLAPLNLVLACGVVAAWARHPRHVLTWATAPLAIVHCVIAHKELRFLFPVAMLSAPLLVLAVGTVPRRGWGRAAAGALIVYNLVALAALILLPAQPLVSFQRFVSRRVPHGVEAFIASPGSPWVWNELTMYFYSPPPAGLRRWSGVPAPLAEGSTQFDLIVQGDMLPPVDPYTCRPLYRSVPEWISRRWWGGLRRIRSWDLYRCELPAPSGSRLGPDAGALGSGHVASRRVSPTSSSE